MTTPGPDGGPPATPGPDGGEAPPRPVTGPTATGALATGALAAGSVAAGSDATGADGGRATGGWPDPLRMAFGTLTAVPVPPPRSLEAPVPGRAMLLAPLAGLWPGGWALVVVWAAQLPGLSAGVAAALGLATYALATRGLHLDGLADTADGLAASYDRGKALDVMRKGDVGPAGMCAVALVLLVQFAALAQALSSLGVVTVLVAALAARVAVPLACAAGVPHARPDGLGAKVAGSVGLLPLVACCALTALTCAAALASAGHEAWPGPVAVAAVLATSWLVLRRATSRLGGMTGDVIGACVELSTAAALLVLAAAG